MKVSQISVTQLIIIQRRIGENFRPGNIIKAYMQARVTVKISFLPVKISFHKPILSKLILSD